MVGWVDGWGGEGGGRGRDGSGTREIAMGGQCNQETYPKRVRQLETLRLGEAGAQCDDDVRASTMRRRHRREWKQREPT
jgi:hypothetical protein